MLKCILIFFVAASCSLSFGQGNRRTAPIVGKGPVVVDVSPIDNIVSLEDLVIDSELVVQGFVEQVLSSRYRNPGDIGSIETDSIVVVQQVLAGKSTSNNERILVTQIGGKVGEAEAIVPQDALLLEGRRYILFLVRDNRAIPNSTGATRYNIAGVWKGRAPIDTGKVRLNLRSEDAPNRAESTVEMDVAEFHEAIRRAATKRSSGSLPR